MTVKVGFYTIALNEVQFVQRWYDSCKDADYLLIADTGSTDGTVELARELGIHVVDVRVKPWRFEVARNASLAAMPLDLDYCVALDMDEIILPNWRENLQHAKDMRWTRPRYMYTWSWQADGTPGLQYGGDKIHARTGYRWKHPVHEVLMPYPPEYELQGWTKSLEIHHYPDNGKSRSQYMPLLKLAVDEDPHDDRNAFYYARELYYHGRYEEATAEFQRHLALPTALWQPERAASYRYLGRTDAQNAEKWFKEAVATSPGSREPYVDLAKYYYEHSRWLECLAVAKEALKIVDKPLEYLCEADAWGYLPHDLVAIAAYNLKMYDEALEHGRKAAELRPDDGRLAMNLKFYEAGASGGSSS